MARNTYQHRPHLIRLLNGAAPLMLPRVSLDPEKLVLTACSRTRLSDFGGNDWREGFYRLCTALEDEARLNLTGRLAARSHLLQLLVNRLQIQAEGSCGGGHIDAPVFITGLPRSGSTLLHELLAQDPAVRVPLTWEVMLPCRGRGQPDKEIRRRISRTGRMLRWVDYLAPRFKTVHPLGPLRPQECIAITAHHFASVEFHTVFNVPSYQDWLDRQDCTAAVLFHRRFLQHLRAAVDGGRWFLKAPAHLYQLPALARVYPDARFIFIHRDPLQVAASIASHGVILRSAFSDEVDARAVADYWMHWWAEGWRRGELFRNVHAVIDIEYAAFIADPIATIGDLYEQLGINYTRHSRHEMIRYLDANGQHSHGRHRYSLEEFGLDAAAVSAAFSG